MTTTDHDIEAYAVQRTGMASARCLTHHTDTTEQWNTLSYAAQRFRCDGGAGLRFITESGVDDTTVTAMRDLSGLARLVHHDAEGRAHGYYEPCTRIWLWLGAGQLEELKVSMQHMSEFDEAEFAYQTWAVTGADGRVITTVRVLIDGRA